MRSLFLCLVLSLAWVVGWGQPASPPVRYHYRDYPLDSLRWFAKQPTVPDTMRVYFLNRLAYATSLTDLPSAIKYISEALSLAHRARYVRGELNCLKELGNFKAESGEYVQALTYYQQGIALALRHHKTRELRGLYLNLGATSATIGDSKQSLKYLLLSYDQLRRARRGEAALDDSALLFSNLGNTYFQLHRFGLARTYALRSVNLYKRLADAHGASQANLLLGRIYQQQDSENTSRLDSAAKYLQQAVTSNQRSNNPKGEAGALLDLAVLYQQQRRYPAMRDAALRSQTLAKEVGSIPFQAAAASLLTTAYAALGDYRQAYGASFDYTALNSIMLNVEKTKAVAQLQAKFDAQNRERRIQQLQHQAQAAAALVRVQQLRQRFLLLIAGLLVLLLTLGTVLYRRLQRFGVLLTKANVEISGAMAEKEVLIQEIHHRVKNNLQVVSSLLGMQLSASLDPALTDVLAGTRARIQGMAAVHEFLYRADNLAEVRLDTFLAELLNFLHQSLTSPRQAISLTTELAPLVMEAKDANALGQLVSELVSNAYKHAFSQQTTGHLHVSLEALPSGFHLRVADDGAGLPATGFEGKPKSLGIQIVKQLAKQLKAKVLPLPNYPSGTVVDVSFA